MLTGVEKSGNEKGWKSSNFSFTENVSVRNLVGASHADISHSKAKLNEGSEDELLITGFQFNLIKSMFTGCLFVMTAGLLWLFLYWMPKVRLWFTHNVVNIEAADTILVEVRHLYTNKIA